MYQYNNNGSGRTYTNWSNKRNNGQQLQAIPPIANTANGKRYYSSIDAELYFGDIFIDEVTNIAWSVQQQTLPIYGYNSYTFDDVAVGSRIIQGQFVINFTQSNFLTKLQNNNAFKKIARRMYGEDKSVKDTDAGKVYSDFRQRLHLPIWDKGFDIVIGYGDTSKNMSGNNGIYSTYMVLNCVQITGSSTQLDYNGDPVQEVYTFMARDIKETFSDAIEANPVSVTSKTPGMSSGSQEDLKLVGTIDLKAKRINLSSPIDVTFSNDVKLQLTGDLKDKNLTIELPLTSNKNTLIYNLSDDFIAAFKKERGDRTQIIGIVKCGYKSNSTSSSTKGQEVQAQVSVNFSIKK